MCPGDFQLFTTYLVPQHPFIHTVDGQNPAPPRMMIIPLFFRVLTIPGGAGFCPSTVFIHGCLNWMIPNLYMKMVVSPNNHFKVDV